MATAGSAVGADPGSADVSLDLTDASGRAGEPVFYNVPVFNAGPATATGVVVTVELAPGLEVVNGGSGCTTSGSTVSCSLGLIPAGAGAVLLWELRAAEPGTYDISGSVRADQTDPVPGNNVDSAQIVVAPSGADVSIDLQDASARAGEAFFYSVAVGNAGPGTATNVVATIELPIGIELLGSGSSCTQSGRIVTCSLGSLGARTGVVIIWQLRAADGGIYTINGSVTADQPDGVPANNSDTGTITVTPAADVAVAVSDSMDPVKPGQGATYTTIVTNYGPSTATNVTLSELWSMSSSKEVSVAAVTTNQGTCAPVGMRLDCQLGTLASGGSATVTIALKPRGGGVLTMSASASATEPDPNAANNSETEATTVGPK
ncbi:MAG TPA: hypothetical protein VGQ58_09490 [Candidatus Limnocylindrales bacterium]|nr:hypothetical protein [Candidatus Limnocylindrales bacterium]